MDARDHSIPPYWDDEVVTEWLNEAQEQACVRGRLIREDADPLICQIPLEIGKHTYVLHDSVYELIDMRVAGSGTEKPRPMELRSREWLNAEHPEWRTMAEPSCWLIQDDTTVRVVGAIKPGDVLHLECYRLPLCEMRGEKSCPEIHRAHHRHLVHWALHKAFGVPDADAFDPVRSTNAEKAFTAYFGPLPDSDMRRITREDVVHHNVAILP